MRIGFFLLVMSVSTLVAVAGRCDAAPGAKSPVLKEDTLPQPPMQRAEWAPPKVDLPADLLSATTRVFQRGMGDPRGCEYRSVSVGTGSCWSGDAGVATCHGWVFPEPDPGKQRFAVCWNGLVYAAVDVGEKADLEADIQDLLKKDDESRAENARRSPDFPFMRFGAGCPGERSSISEKSMLAGKVCMLLRVGAGDLAIRYWKAWRGPAVAGQEAQEPYKELLGNLIWVEFDRAICAHMRADDHLAKVAEDALIRLKKASDEEPHPQDPNGRDRRPTDYLDVLPGLVADTERRLKEPPRKSALKQGEKAFANRAAWIAALIQDLEQVSARQSGQPGGVSLGDDPIVEALIAVGDDAVEPLLETFEHDARLTRSVHFWRDFAPTRRPLDVSEAAYVALSAILQTSFFSTASTGDDLTAHGEAGRHAVSERIRDYWKKYKGISLADRWFTILGDDKASPEQWLQAMDNITRPVDVTVSPGSMFGTGWIMTPSRKPGERPKLTGESLRTREKPSVLDLVAKRIDQIDALDPGNSQHVYHAASATSMAMQAADWDLAKAVPILNKQLNYCVGLFSNKFLNAYGEPLLQGIAKLAVRLAAGGDRSGLKVYGDWIRTISPANLGTEPQELMSPLWKYPDDPAMVATAEALFNDPKSAWNPMLPRLNTGWRHEQLLWSPLLGIKSFRDQMQRGLQDKTPYATLVVHANREAELKLTKGGGNSVVIPTQETRLPPRDVPMTLRACDNYASQLSNAPGMPAFAFYWPEPDRDAAIKACSDSLNRFGSNLRYNEQYPSQDPFEREGTAQLWFTPLDHPATLKDVEEAKAIFSLEGQGERRLFKLPTVPMKATWVALKQYPVDQQTFNPTTSKSEIQHTFEQSCQVWQAEEVKVGDQWQRYFGVVGPHGVSKAPAAEIEFDGGYDWQQLTHGVDCRVTGPDSGARNGNEVTFTAPASSSSMMKVELRNRLGIAQALPLELISKLDTGVFQIRPGVTIIVERLAEAVPDEAQRELESGAKISMKPMQPMDAARAARQTLVEAAGEVEVCNVDLRKCFDIAAPGRYRVQVVFSKESSIAAGDSAQVAFTVAVAPR